LDRVAGNVSFALGALERQEELKNSYKQINKAMEDSVKAIATLAEHKDPYTVGHERQVALIALAIATEMGLSENARAGLRIAATLHDVGKIYVPAEILSKPGELTELEFRMIKVHPRYSYDVLKEIDFPWPIADIALQHHERMDGSGYPEGLKGESIRMEARILAVADVIEAMASHRPYRPALTIKDALAEIKKNRGKLYDPVVVDATLKIFAEGFTFEA
jgi:HD-GYP domain-containing protein (c-di-GMP phosphodiesterase class II)